MKREMKVKVKEMHSRLDSYVASLLHQELAKATVHKYKRDVNKFLEFVGNKESLKKSDVMEYKYFLISRHKAATVNSYLIAINKYFGWLEKEQLAVKTIRMQRKSSLENVISETEYWKLVDVCKKNHEHRDYLILRTLAATGIRISELPYITVEAIIAGTVEVHKKGKSRAVIIPTELAPRLLKYCKAQGIESGCVFKGNNNHRSLHPTSVWKILKRIALEAGVRQEKVYPHSLRHLFAKTYMRKFGNIFELADLLGHSSIETTRLYTLTTTYEKRKSVNSLNL